MVPLLVTLLSRLKRHHVVILVSVAGASIVLGSIAFSISQHVSLGTGLYWAIVTAATVGYGDVVPHDAGGRVIAIVVILTTIPLLAAVFALMAGLAAVVQVRRLLGMEHDLPDGQFSVVYGDHPSVPRIVEELITSGRQVVLVSSKEPAEVRAEVRLISGDPTNEVVIRKSKPERAADALVVGAEDGDVLVTSVALRSAAPELQVFALANSPKIAQALRELGVHQTLSSDELVAHTLAKSLEAPHAGDLLLRLIDSERYRIDETPVSDEMVGKQATDLELGSPAIVFGVVRDDAVTLVLDDDAQLKAGDVLVTLTSRDG